MKFSVKVQVKNNGTEKDEFGNNFVWVVIEANTKKEASIAAQKHGIVVEVA